MRVRTNIIVSLYQKTSCLVNKIICALLLFFLRESTCFKQKTEFYNTPDDQIGRIFDKREYDMMEAS